MKNRLLIVGGTSGIMIGCLKSFLKKKYKIFATYSNEKSLMNIPNNLRKSKNIRFIKLNLMEENEKILRIIKKNKVKADIIINAVGGSFNVKRYPYELNSWQKALNLNILKHILINNFFLKKMVNQKFGRILFFSTQAVDDPGASITYSTSKAFLENYVKKSSILFGKHNVLINCIRTSIIAAKNNNWYKGTISNSDKVDKFVKKYLSVEKIGKTEHLIDFINSIISSKNRFMNGSIVKIDGGIK